LVSLVKKIVGVKENESDLKMLQLALLNFPKGTLFNRASAFPLVRLRRTGLASELQ
jgi:hypothetical protein